MGTIEEKLEYLNETKTQIKNALISKGADVNNTDTFRSYANKINEIKTTPNLQSKSITVQNTYQTTISPDSGYDGLSKAVVTLKGGRAGYARFYRASTGQGTYNTSINDYDPSCFTVSGDSLVARYAGTIYAVLYLTTTGTTRTAHYCRMLKAGSAVLTSYADAKTSYSFSISVSAGQTIAVQQYTDSSSYPVTADCRLVLVT